MKLNNTYSKLKPVKNFKFYMLFPIVIALLAIVFGCVFGLNLDYDFRNVSTFTVKFNTTIEAEEYEIFEEQLGHMTDAKFENFRIKKIGDGAQNGLFVQIVNPDSKLDEAIDSFKLEIEENLLAEVEEDITSSVIITTTDTELVLAKSVGDLVGYSILAIACMMVFVFLYYLFRYNLIASCSIVLTFVFEIAMLTSVMIVARIPFNYYFVIAYFVMMFATTIVASYINNSIRNNLNNEQFSKYSNSDRIEDAVHKTSTPILILISLVILSLLAVMFFGGYSLVYTMIAVIVGLGITLFAEYFFNLPVWAMFYKKQKDAALRRRIEAINKKNSENLEDKVVV